MALEPAITGVEQLKERPEVARLLAWNGAAVTGAKFDRKELTLWVDRTSLREACLTLKNDPPLQYNALADITCVDWYTQTPRFEVVYQLFSTVNKTYLRLKVKLSGEDASVDSLTSIWPGANFFEREVFDLFGVRFDQHPNLKRIMMPEDWEGHPLRKDYPVEGYR
jgi:NADH-quinone oxidoreductase subunit C